MTRLLLSLALISGLCGCVVAQPYGYGYGPAPAYYAPGYYYGPPVSIGIGGNFHIH
ncbi:hypothetical protein [Paraburkholderia solisilvae]|jgi:hypothetical protein|uniref:Lipoprotein n=1 Tax=Paraburkholderia solisilvae TaxID=624376 RepID=A0A6J5ESC6_9BURK|nr:hypothetical protein [Paraburkholderia solisilvae]CAB3768311.1 hypothetical protein LMG29739_05283 [Paraburkholderia solisilvae]